MGTTARGVVADDAVAMPTEGVDAPMGVVSAWPMGTTRSVGDDVAVPVVPAAAVGMSADETAARSSDRAPLGSGARVERANRALEPSLCGGGGLADKTSRVDGRGACGSDSGGGRTC